MAEALRGKRGGGEGGGSRETDESSRGRKVGKRHTEIDECCKDKERKEGEEDKINAGGRERVERSEESEREKEQVKMDK